jgi:hypothetical protein
MLSRFAVTALLLFLSFAPSGTAQEKPPPSAIATAKALVGSWELIKAKEGVRLVLEFEATKNEQGLWMITKEYRGKGKDEELNDIHWGGIAVQEKDGKLFFNRQSQPIDVQFKDGKLVLAGEYKWLGSTFNLTGQWKKLEKQAEKK